MNSDPQISVWLQNAKAGDAEAITRLWEHYFPQLVRLARQKLAGAPKQMADEEDVALSAFNSFWKAAEQGRFPDLQDRDGLWRLLFRITARKAVDLKRHQTCERRGGGHIQNSPAASKAANDPELDILSQMASDTPTPELVAIMAEECKQRLGALPSDLQALAVLKLEGFTNEEIAGKLDCALRTIERRLHRIRKSWEQRQDGDGAGSSLGTD